MFYHGTNDESKSILDLSAGGQFMSLTLEEEKEHIEKIVSAHEQWIFKNHQTNWKNIPY